jgi:prolyl-tRNA synthetase
MDAIGGQEVSFPVVMPKELWEESGRYAAIGEEMVRFEDRCGRPMVLGMTHEEAAVHLCKNWVSSYQQLPFMIYQIQTKFRDEARSRGGLIRVREFVMKDAYSFHADKEDLEAYYDKVYEAYNRIFKRIGMKDFVAVKSDSGMMGGNVAHEYMLLTEAGEDTIAICADCGYKANIEVAESVREPIGDEISEDIAEVYTADKTEIAELCDYLKIRPLRVIKAVSYNIKGSDQTVLVFIRGDLEVNEAKLKKIIKKDIAPSNLQDSKELVAGNIGPIGLRLNNAIIIYDKSLQNCNNMYCGANKPEYHLKGVDVQRDMQITAFYDVAKVKEGESCPVCGKALSLRNGIEVGNIFQLGDKYTKSMNMAVLDSEGKAFNPIMGCYGIGIGRALASVAEESNDEYGLIWPMSIAPWHVYLCPLRIDNPEIKQKADELYNQMTKAGIEVLYDDRDISPGVKFSDCDLMGIPLRLVISPKTLANNQTEIQSRDRRHKLNPNTEDTIRVIQELIKE